MIKGEIKKYEEHPQTSSSYSSPLYADSVIKEIQKNITLAEELGIKVDSFVKVKTTGTIGKVVNLVSTPAVCWESWVEPPTILRVQIPHDKGWNFVLFPLDDVELYVEKENVNGK